MRFSGERQVRTSVEHVWAALHDREVLRATIPGCEDLVPLEAGRYAATLAARVGPVADTYRGAFTIEDLRALSELRVRVVPVPAGEPGHKNQVGGTGHRQQLGRPLDQAEGRGSRRRERQTYGPTSGAGSGGGSGSLRVPRRRRTRR